MGHILCWDLDALLDIVWWKCCTEPLFTPEDVAQLLPLLPFKDDASHFFVAHSPTKGVSHKISKITLKKKKEKSVLSTRNDT